MGCRSVPAVPVNWVRIKVMKKVDAVGICLARIVATDDGFSAMGLIEATRPDDRVTTKNVCWKGCQTMSCTLRPTHDDEEDKVSGHDGQLDFGLTGQALSSSDT
jgi:hypothetical protein